MTLEPPNKLPKVIEFLDYREYLRAYYEFKKAEKRGFSYRSFSKRAGLRSPNYLKLVSDGERNLTSEMSVTFSKALGLEGEDAKYFVNLVAFTQAKNPAERKLQYESLSSFRKFQVAHKLDIAQAAYHSTWFIPALRELAGRKDFQDDPAWIAKTMVPAISRSEASRALQTLLELGLLHRNTEGRIVRGEARLATARETRSVHIANYHREMMERASAAIDLFPAEHRDISSTTLCVGAQSIALYKERVQHFRSELLELEAIEENPGVVIQINFQLFPLSAIESQPTDEE